MLKPHRIRAFVKYITIEADFGGPPGNSKPPEWELLNNEPELSTIPRKRGLKEQPCPAGGLGLAVSLSQDGRDVRRGRLTCREHRPPRREASSHVRKARGLAEWAGQDHPRGKGICPAAEAGKKSWPQTEYREKERPT